MKLKSLTTFLLALALSLALTSCLKADKKGGPVFIQVHFTSSLKNISPEKLALLMKGEIKNFKDLGGDGGDIHIYCDSKIFPHMSRLYPDLKLMRADFKTGTALASDRSFMGLSDASGLMPHFRAVSIDDEMPWGKIDQDYSISHSDSYGFRLAAAEQWDEKESITLVQTGVTAMTRAFIRAMDMRGSDYDPVKYTRHITSPADISTASNEVSFLDPCTYPLKNNMLFCSPKSFFKILGDSKFKVIELTGNHNNDYGKNYSLDTISMIEGSGMKYFGGGKNSPDAERVLYISAKEKRFAFVGFNELGPPLAWATATEPGAARLSEKSFRDRISEGRANSDILVVSVQWGNENDAVPWKIQTEFFHMAADMGADIMISSSAHRAMGMEFHKGKFISYGLGNFLFDQMQSKNHRQGVIARHRFYKGRHVQTELIPYMIYDSSQPRLLYGNEARDLLERIFSLSRGYVFK